MATSDLTRLESHFAFGRNWRSYAALVDEARIAAAERGLLALLPPAALAGRSFVDIGSGSGVHALAAMRLGAAPVLATDLDPEAVSATAATFARFGAPAAHAVRQVSVLEMSPEVHGTFDVVYSWGVLHHTGALREAIARAARLVGATGWLALALYGPTALDGWWLREKRWYARASPRAQSVARGVFDVLRGAPALRASASGRATSVGRGMELWHDLHDWLGGYPCETIAADEVEAILSALGFRAVRVQVHPRRLGVFGAGCNEYVYVRR